MKVAFAVLLTLTLAPAVALAQHHSHSSHGSGDVMPMMAADTDATDGVVQKIDQGAGKITLKHGEIKNLGMPPMTMVFRVKDKILLEKVSVGEKVKFRAEQPDGTYTVTAIDSVK
ncbi:MAG: copper-binding protein [Burkholderiales bacterium]|nr:copper-binding protein [Burkholderiales bacterium]